MAEPLDGGADAMPTIWKSSPTLLMQQPLTSTAIKPTSEWIHTSGGSFPVRCEAREEGMIVRAEPGKEEKYRRVEARVEQMTLISSNLVQENLSLREHIQSLTDRLAFLESTASATTSELVDVEVSGLRGRLLESARRETQRIELDKKKLEGELADSEETCASLRDEAQAARLELHRAREELATTKVMARATQRALDELDVKYSAVKADLVEAVSETTELKTRNEKLESRLALEKERGDRFEGEAALLRKGWESLTTKLVSQGMDLKVLKANIPSAEPAPNNASSMSRVTALETTEAYERSLHELKRENALLLGEVKRAREAASLSPSERERKLRQALKLTVKQLDASCDDLERVRRLGVAEAAASRARELQGLRRIKKERARAELHRKRAVVADFAAKKAFAELTATAALQRTIAMTPQPPLTPYSSNWGDVSRN